MVVMFLFDQFDSLLLLLLPLLDQRQSRLLKVDLNYFFLLLLLFLLLLMLVLLLLFDHVLLSLLTLELVDVLLLRQNQSFDNLNVGLREWR